MSELTSTTFWLDAAERAIKTGAQTAVATLGTGAIGILDVDWLNILSIVLMAMVLSVLTSIASAGKADTLGAASLVSTPAAAKAKHAMYDCEAVKASDQTTLEKTAGQIAGTDL